MAGNPWDTQSEHTINDFMKQWTAVNLTLANTYAPYKPKSRKIFWRENGPYRITPLPQLPVPIHNKYTVSPKDIYKKGPAAWK